MAAEINTNIKNLDNCCRTCLNDAQVDMYDVFEQRSDLLDIPRIIFMCTNIEISRQDLMPKKICPSCYNFVLNFHEFRDRAVNAYIQLQEHLNSSVVVKSEENNTDIEIEGQWVVLGEPENNEYLSENVNSGLDISFDSDTTLKDENLTENNLNSGLDNSLDSDMPPKEESNPQTDTVAVSTDISDATQLDEQQTTNDVVTCNKCGKDYTSQEKLEKHKKRHEKIYICDICSRRFNYYYKYREHLYKHIPTVDAPRNVETNNETEPTQSLQCEICSETFRSVNSLSAHQRKHTPKDRVLACKTCGVIFKKLSHLKRHEMSHSIKAFTCTTCDKAYVSEAAYSDHMNKHLGIMPHACPVCDKAFTHLSSLKTHLRVHTKEKPYLCSICGKTFDSSTNLNQHVNRHQGVKSFSCHLCPRRFVSKGELTSHIVTHTGVKKYSCDQCSASFTKNSSLTTHKLRHLGIKRFECEACPMKFTCKDHLKRHNRIHTGERPYRCDICDRAFTQSNDLIKHKRSHLGNNLYKCDQCTQCFRLMTELRQHISEHFLSSQLEALKVTNSDNNQPTDNSQLVDDNQLVDNDQLVDNNQLVDNKQPLNNNDPRTVLPQEQVNDDSEKS